MRADAGMALFVCMLVMWFSPKIASAIDILLRPDLRRGVRRRRTVRRQFRRSKPCIRSCCARSSGSAIPSSSRGLLFGREIGWIGQTRDDHAVPFTLALHNLWPHTLLGCAALGLLAIDAAGGYSLCAVSRRRPGAGDPVCRDDRLAWLGSFAARIGIGRLPEETARPAALLALELPAIELAAPSPRPSAV